jgi:2-methylcitrate dehydratase PrpD
MPEGMTEVLGTTEVLAEFAATLSVDDIPAGVRDFCKLLILDALACALAGHQGEETGQLNAMASALAQSQESSVFGGGKLSLAGATLMNGYLITAVTMCDVHRATLTHITPEVIPPAFAIAERDSVSGCDLLAAIAAGLEVTTRIGIGLDYPVFRGKGWHGPGVIGPFGSAAAVGRQRGFDTDTMARAFGLAGSQSAGSFAAWGTPTVKWHQCRAALSGLMAALLAEQDFVVPKEFLTAADGGLYNTYAEGGKPEDAVADLGKHWELQEISLRLWPSATALQEVLTALYSLVQQNEVAFDDIAKVRLALSKTPFDMHGGFSTYKAKFEALLSAHYVAAVYLRDRTLTLEQFDPTCYDDPALRRFAADQVTVTADTSLKGGQCIAEVETKDGKTLSARCDYPLGAPQNPVSRQQIEDKFRTCAKAILPADRIDGVIDSIARMEALDNAGTLLELLRR